MSFVSAALDLLEFVPLHVDDNPIGAIIEARVVPTKLYFIDSDVSITSIDRPAEIVSPDRSTSVSF